MRVPGRSFRPSGAMVIALLALFFSVGGLGYARQVVRLINGHQIKKGTIDANRLSRAARASLKGNAGPNGAQGPKGDQGPAGLSTGPAGGALTGSYPNPSLASGTVDTPNFASGATAPNAAKLGGLAASRFWQLAGNAATTNPPTDFLGTTDNQPLIFKVNGQQALLLQPDSTSPNVVGGSSANSVAAGKRGATIGGGGKTNAGNSVAGDFGTVGGGQGSTASDLGTVGGGQGSTAGHFATVAGGNNNTASGEYSTASGESNTASGLSATAFGAFSTASGTGSTASGAFSTASGPDSTASGYTNKASGNYSTAFGFTNTASGIASTASGNTNSASGNYSTAFGFTNTASGIASTASGYNSSAGGNYSTAFGAYSQASGNYSTAFGNSNTASGIASTAFGTLNQDGGASSFAGGNSGVVQAGHDNTFLWSDGNAGSTAPTAFTSSAANQFDVRSTGGVTFQTNPGGTFSTGCQLAAGGGAWSCTSDRNAKTGFASISDQQLLRRLAALAIRSWSYKTDPAHVRHIGPTAQDFKSAFGVGNDPRSIGVLDESGVALAGVKGVYQLVQQQQTLMHRQQAEITSLQADLTHLEATLTK
jgi:trimeric autotransporter adhesin